MYGLQLYSIRDVTPNDMAGALRKVAAMGYSFVEPAGFFGIPAEEFRGMLRDNGLGITGTHTHWPEIRDRFEETCAYHRAIGNNMLIVPGHDLSDRAKIDAFVEEVNNLQPKLAEQGFRLGYHNHSHEFQPNPDGSVIYEELAARTRLLLEVDTFWAWNAGQDPVALLDRLGYRVPVIHIKDGLAGGEGKPLGQGDAPVRAVFEKARAMGIPMVVESETLVPDGLTEASVCIEYLKGLERQR